MAPGRSRHFFAFFRWEFIFATHFFPQNYLYHLSHGSYFWKLLYIFTTNFTHVMDRPVPHHGLEAHVTSSPPLAICSSVPSSWCHIAILHGCTDSTCLLNKQHATNHIYLAIHGSNDDHIKTIIMLPRELFTRKDGVTEICCHRNYQLLMRCNY